MSDSFKVAIVGSGPGGISAAGRAAESGVSHVLLEAETHLSNTIYRYQKGKHVMAEPSVLPLRSPLGFQADTRENILKGWRDDVARLNVNIRYGAEVTGISGQRGDFTITLKKGGTVRAEYVVLGIGLQGNIRKLGTPGEDLERVQYQLDDPREYEDETIAVIGAGDAAIENALALAEQNNVIIVNRGEEFSHAKDANDAAIRAAIESGAIEPQFNSTTVRVEEDNRPRAKPLLLVLDTPEGQAEIPCDRIIARIGAIPPRRFVESCGIEFPNDDPAAVPAVSAQYESNVPGLYIVGALGGYPLIKQAMNQGYEVIEYIEGNPVEPADEPLLREKFGPMPGFTTVDEALALVKEKVPVLAGLTTLQLREFMLDSDVLVPAEGETIFEYNDYTNTFMSILKGEVEVQIDPEDPSRTITLHAGQFFGEMGLISGRRRTATVVAGPGCVLIETPRRSMNKMISSVESVKRAVDEAFLLRAIQQQIAPGVPAELLTDVVHSAEICHYKAGDVLFSEGEPGDCLHLVRKGSVTVSRLVGDHEVVLSYMPAGTYVGEMALLSDAPRSATVRAAVPTETIRLDGDSFKMLLDWAPELREQLEAEFEVRAREGIQREAETEAGNLISFLMQQGLGEATDVLLIDESLCVRCNHCERACSATHQGISRLNREAGPTYAGIHVPTSCRHCEHPHCMKDCPPDAIHRSPNGEVYIADNCIGCGNCQRNCPYGVIQMGKAVPEKISLMSWLLFGRGRAPGDRPPPAGDGADVAKRAVKCDMCKDLPGGPACVRACPTGAALRVRPEEFMAAQEQ